MKALLSTKFAGFAARIVSNASISHRVLDWAAAAAPAEIFSSVSAIEKCDALRLAALAGVDGTVATFVDGGRG